MIKKLEVKESKEKLSTSFFVSTLLNILLIIVMMGLNSTGYKNSYIYFLISIMLLINTVPVWLELEKHKNVTKKNKNPSELF